MATYTITDDFPIIHLILKLPTIESTISHIKQYRHKDREMYEHCINDLLTRFPEIPKSILSEYSTKDDDAKIDELISKLQLSSIK